MAKNSKYIDIKPAYNDLTEKGITNNIGAATSLIKRLKSDIKRCVKDNYNGPPKTFFELGVAKKAFQLVLDGAEHKPAIEEAAKLDNLSQEQLDDAWGNTFSKDRNRQLLKSFAYDINKLTRKKYLQKNYLSSAERLPQLLKRLEMAIYVRNKVDKLEHDKKEHKLIAKNLELSEHQDKAKKAIKLKEQGFKIKEISKIIERGERQVSRYLNRT